MNLGFVQPVTVFWLELLDASVASLVMGLVAADVGCDFCFVQVGAMCSCCRMFCYVDAGSPFGVSDVFCNPGGCVVARLASVHLASDSVGVIGTTPPFCKGNLCSTVAWKNTNQY
jgi:hypothetical protein